MLSHYPIIHVAMWVTALLFSIAVCLNIYRILVGPSLPDRIAALDTLSVNAIGLILLIGIGTGSRYGFEAGLLITLFSFLTTAALCKYLLRGMIIE
ncbi:K+/H+ antiporter subunit F [Carnimonas nigrificans]|uniref:K+/H+ antiporter subunit F n=1 Tax=Carnimonas nigrificans TaxID=64323 RepID=UPI0004B46DDA|nr:K+/H+ antiporter subunit F [Carnimonas nigrificans]